MITANISWPCKTNNRWEFLLIKTIQKLSYSIFLHLFRKKQPPLLCTTMFFNWQNFLNSKNILIIIIPENVLLLNVVVQGKSISQQIIYFISFSTSIIYPQVKVVVLEQCFEAAHSDVRENSPNTQQRHHANENSHQLSLICFHFLNRNPDPDLWTDKVWKNIFLSLVVILSHLITLWGFFLIWF